MYPNDKEVRNILGFLIESLPRESAEQKLEEQVESPFVKNFKNAMAAWKQETWMPPFENKKRVKFLRRVIPISTEKPKNLPKELEKDWAAYIARRKQIGAYVMNFRPGDYISYRISSMQTTKEVSLDMKIINPVKKNAKPKNVMDTVIYEDTEIKKLPGLVEVLEKAVVDDNTEVITTGVFVMELKSEKRDQIMAINNEKGAEKLDEKQAQEQFQEEVAKLEAQLEEVNLEVDTSETNALTLKSKIEEYSRKLEEITRHNEELKKEAEQKHRLALLLSDQALSLSKLEKELEDNESKLASMKTEWENYKAPLLEEIQQKEKFLEKQKKKYKDELEEIKLMREEMKEMVQEAELKDEMYDLLLDEESRTASNINRNVYIKTITDVINKLKQQKRGISKILKDVAEVQKSISMFRDTLQRVDAETENMMFESASKAKKKDVLPRAIYKLLVDLREQYTLLVRTVEDQLKIKNSIQDLEIRIESVRSRTANKDVEKLKEDLEKIRQERVS